ncbi:MAG: heme lyase CcmF/NrfE family subunit [Rhizobiales bacterium]|nr:heme lyase CcmF/NrfE family subunit [Hyphomicrobiales bacterium]NRB13374.1 heme lyase CcmF/NrfE family subunit [Hyphomicrobiales bacterium]
MLAEFGQFTLILSFFVALFQTTIGLLPLLSSPLHHVNLRNATQRAAKLQAILIGISFAILLILFASSDFSIKIIFEHSHSLKPLFFKLAATWGNHEGSILLFALIISLLGGFLALFGRKLDDKFITLSLAIQAMLAVAIIGFILFTSNPFERLFIVPLEGNNLNPLLQDWALAIHPPLLYLGYVGLSIPFSFAIAALLTEQIDEQWAKWVRPWTLFAWSCLTGGIALGSYWAYYELGWGGFWFWDPVENASLMPWLAATALLHSAIVMEKRGALGSWTILLAIIAFGLSLLGTFLVRSGILTSVHAFAVDPARGLVILGILFYFMAGAFSLYAFKSGHIKQRGIFAPISREGALLLNNLLISVMLVTVFVGTLYPLFIDAIGGSKLSVGAPFFNQTFIPLAVPLLILLPIGTMLKWKRGDLGEALRLLLWVFFASFAAVLIFYYLSGYKSIMAWAGMLLGIWLIFGALFEILYSARFGQLQWHIALRRLLNLRRAKFAVMCAHMGVGIMVLGLAAMSAWRVENIKDMTIGDHMTIAGFELEFDSIENVTGDNYNEIVGNFLLSKDGEALGVIKTSKRRYLKRDTPTTEVGLYNHNLGQIYVAFGQLGEDNKVQLRAYYNPLVLFIWLGPLIMMLGGLLSLTDRQGRKIRLTKLNNSEVENE